MKKGVWTALLAGAGMGLLILDGGTALRGAREGIQMCLYTVLPTLFPFFVLSGLLTGAIRETSWRGFRALERFCRMPQGSGQVFALGLLGGYPTGARCVHQLWDDGQLDKKDAQRMLGFCSNAGPSFLFGICGELFPGIGAAWALWGCHILSALMVARMLPGGPTSGSLRLRASSVTVTEALAQAVKTGGLVCGWVVLFRVLLAFVGKWLPWELPLISGALELTNGCLALGRVTSPGSRFVLCGVFLGLGGLCVGLQTASVVGALGTRWYWKGKLLQGLWSLMLCSGVQYFLFSPGDRAPGWGMLLAISGGILAVFAFRFKKRRKICSNSGAYGV